MANPLIEIKQLTKVYGTEIKNEVLHQLSLEIEKGEFIAIIGPSGSGKSTFLNILGALDQSTSGEVLINRQNVSQLDDAQLAKFRNRNLGFVFQFHHLLPEFTALENVMIPDWIKEGKALTTKEKRAEKLLSLVGLKEFKDKLITKLSGGQKQRVAIARALMNQPDILLADEPTGNLDSETTEKIYNLLREINQDLDTTFIVVTHDRHIAAKTDRIIELVDGNINRDFKTSANEDDDWQKLAPCYCREKKSK